MNVLAVYDISSSSVAGAHVVRTDAAPVMLASARTNIPLQDDINMSRFVEEGVKHLGQIVEQIKAKDAHHPTHIQVILASPWYVSQTRTIVYKQEKAFTCTSKLVDGLVDREVEAILAEGGSFGPDSVVVEKQISSILLNGYETSTPFGKHATSLELFLSVTVAPKPVLERFTDVLQRGYGTRTISFTTSPFATYVVMRDVMPSLAESIIIDVGEEITDVAFIKGGIMLYQHSFPVGTFELYRTLASIGRHTTAEAHSMLEAYRLGKLDTSAVVPVEKAIEAFLGTWRAAFREILEGGHYGFCVPSQCTVTADPKFQQLFTRVLTTDEFLKHRCTVGEVTVKYLDESVLAELVRTADQTALDVPLATAAVFAGQTVHL